MTNDQYEAMKYAIELLEARKDVNKMQGDIWIVYRVGNIIRVDIKQ